MQRVTLLIISRLNNDIVTLWPRDLHVNLGLSLWSKINPSGVMILLFNMKGNDNASLSKMYIVMYIGPLR